MLWLSSLFKELGILLNQNSPPIIWCDNTGAGSLASNPMFHVRTKHIEVYVHFIREKVASKQLEAEYVPTKEQIAHVFTKPFLKVL